MLGSSYPFPELDWDTPPPPSDYSQIKQLFLGNKLQSKSGDNDFKGIWEGTTWLQPVPFTGMDKDEKKEITRIIDNIMKEGFYTPGRLMDERIHFVTLTGDDLGEESFRVGPVLQMISVSISNKSDASLDNDFDICGEISIPDDNNNIFNIYKRDENNPERLTTERNHLLLNGCTVQPVLGGNLKFSLTNKNARRQIFEGDYDVEEESSTEGDGKFTLNLCGKDGYRASMVFNKIWFAGIAKVDMYLFDTTSGQEGTFKVHGTIKVNDVVCFQTRLEEAVEMVHGKFNGFGQSRYVFAVPVFTSLVVKIELFSGELEVADDKVELIYPYDYSFDPSFTSETPCKDKSYSFGMDVKWIPHDDYFRGCSFGLWEDELNVKWSSRVGQISPPFTKVTSDHLVEVFSICIAGGDSSPLALCGTIVVRDGGRAVYIFSRNKEIPDKFSSGEQLRIVSLAWPIDRWVLLKDFFMHLKLKDDHDNKVCRGSLEWSIDVHTRYEVRLCDVIRGEKGYFAAVHYSVFKNGKRAKVSVKWKGDYSLVYGSVVAEYSNYNYASTYDKEYYRSIIFKRPEEEGVKVRKGSKIPLSKSHVSAPSDCKGLRIYVRLWYRPINFPVAFPGQNVKLWCDPILFEANAKPCPQLGGCLSVKVTWE